MDLDTLAAEAERLVFPAFGDDTALRLGLTLVELARARALAVVIDIRTADRTLFHAAMPGATPLFTRWARRKSATALMFHEASMTVGAKLRASGGSLAANGLDPQDYADHGGAVPIRVRGVGVVAVATVSGLPQADDHALVVQAMDLLLANPPA